MSNVEVLDPLEEEKNKAKAKCFGQFDAAYTECTQDCALSPQCKKFTEQAPKAAPPAPPLEETESLPDITPHDFLIQSLKGRYEVEEKKKGGLTNYLCYKDGAGVAQVGSLDDGRYLFRTQKATLELKELESVKQASEIFKAILIV
jgi:hypothetical protein